MKDVNKTTKGDVAHALVKGGLGAIPILGSAAAELFGLIIAPPLDKRRQQWMNEVADKLKELEESGRIDFKALSENEQFIDTVIQATSYALKTSEAEKIAAFKNAAINVALDEAPEKSKSQVFLNLVDRYTVWHIRILSFFDDPKKWFSNAGKKPPNLYMGSMYSALLEAYPQLKGQAELVTVIWNDLGSAGFHNTGDLKTMMSGDGVLASRTTELGQEFLEFISES